MQTSNIRRWWSHWEPASKVPRTALHSEYVTPNRYHQKGLYSTVDPTMPLWKQVRASIADDRRPYLLKMGDGTWTLEDIHIHDADLAARVALLLTRHRPQDGCLRFHMSRESSLPLNQELYPRSSRKERREVAHQ